MANGDERKRGEMASYTWGHGTTLEAMNGVGAYDGRWIEKRSRKLIDIIMKTYEVLRHEPSQRERTNP